MWPYALTAAGALALFIIIGNVTKKWLLPAVAIICLGIGGVGGFWLSGQTLGANCLRMDQQVKPAEGELKLPNGGYTTPPYTGAPRPDPSSPLPPIDSSNAEPQSPPKPASEQR